MECILTNEQLQERLAYWQKVLRLQDWTIRVAFRHVVDMEPGNEAEVDTNFPLKRAAIAIVYPDEYRSRVGWPQEVEESLVHELLHLHLEPWQVEKGSLEYVLQEQAVESLAHALVELARGQHDYKNSALLDTR